MLSIVDVHINDTGSRLIRKPLNKQVPPEIAAKRRQQQKQTMAIKDQDE